MSFIEHRVNREVIHKNLYEFDLAYKENKEFWNHTSTFEKVIFVVSCLTIFGGIGYGLYLNQRTSTAIASEKKTSLSELKTRISTLKNFLKNSKHKPQEITLLILDDLASNRRFIGKYTSKDLALVIGMFDQFDSKGKDWKTQKAQARLEANKKMAQIKKDYNEILRKQKIVSQHDYLEKASALNDRLLSILNDPAIFGTTFTNVRLTDLSHLQKAISSANAFLKVE